MIKIRKLYKAYGNHGSLGSTMALEDIELDIHAGLFGLVGPEGSGKSTIMRILAGLLDATSGLVRINGIDVLSHPEAMWLRLGYVPQSYGFYSDVTGLQMLTHLIVLKAASRHGSAKHAASHLLDHVGLGTAARDRLSTYTPGMRQRLALAQAIAGNPQVILVDEPLLDGDAHEQQILNDLLHELLGQRIVVIASRSPQFIGELCDGCAILSGGQLLQATTTSAARESLRGRVFAQKHHPATTRIVLPHGEEPPSGFSEVEATFEDAYLSLTEEWDTVDDIDGTGNLDGIEDIDNGGAGDARHTGEGVS